MGGTKLPAPENVLSSVCGATTRRIKNGARGEGTFFACNPANQSGDFDIGGQYQIYEMLLYNAYLNTTDRQKVEGYLAWKWGLQANLPGGHPYASAAPQS